MTIPPSAQTEAAQEMFDDLKRMVEGIDRRVPHRDVLQEAPIAREAAALREQAVTLMRALEAAIERPPS